MAKSFHSSLLFSWLCQCVAGLFIAFHLVLGVTPGWAEESEPLRPRVPVSERFLARKMKPPFGSTKAVSSEILLEGKQLYEGKGTCASCHGELGLGDGPNGRRIEPSPRDFTNCKFHHRRTDGELFWILQNGSPGLGMPPMIPVTVTKEEAWKILAYERSFCKDWVK